MGLRKQFIALSAVLSLAVGLSGCGSLQSPGTANTSAAQSGSETAAESAEPSKAQVLTLTFALPENSAHYEAGKKFAELVNQYTDGAYEVEVYPNSSLASGNQLGAIEMVQKGTISCGWLSPLVQCSIEPNLNALCIPFLWKDTDAIDAALRPGTDVDAALNKILKEKGYIAVAYAENGYRELTNSKREIKTPEDMKGIKFRAIGSTMIFDVFKAMGANPMDLNFSELFTALQQKTVDGQENPISTVIVPQKYYEVQDYMTIWNYVYEPHPLMFNLELWESFSPETQQAIQKAAIEACDYQKKLSRDALAENVELIKQSGTTVTELTPEEIQAFKDVAVPVVEGYYADFNPELMGALQAANQ